MTPESGRAAGRRKAQQHEEVLAHEPRGRINPHTVKLIDAQAAQELVGSLTEGDLEYLIRVVRAGIRKEQNRAANAKRRGGTVPGRDANQFKLDRANDLEARLIKALGRDLPDGRGGGKR